jgi:hypothetical protein
MQFVFATRPVDPVDGLVIIAIGAVLFLVIEAEKKLLGLVRSDRARA